MQDSVQVVASTSQSISLVCNAGTSSMYYLTVVYADCNPVVRRDMFSDLLLFAQSLQNVPWLVTGDFNCISQPSEKLDGNLSSSISMSDFNDFIRVAGLFDAGYIGSPYTWSNNRTGSASVRSSLSSTTLSGLALPFSGMGRMVKGAGIGFLGIVSTDRSMKESLWFKYARSRFLKSPFSEVTKAFPSGISKEVFNAARNLIMQNRRWVIGYGKDIDILRHKYAKRFDSRSKSVKSIIFDIRYAANVAVQGMIFKKDSSPNQLKVLQQFGFKPLVKLKVSKLVRWNTPQYGFSLNVDGACKGNPGPCGGGGCIRNSNGDIHLGFAFYYGQGNNMLAEVRALSDGLRLAEHRGLPISIVNSDSLALVHSFNSNMCPSWKCTWWWRIARSFLSKPNIKLVHVYWETNKVVDVLASMLVTGAVVQCLAAHLFHLYVKARFYLIKLVFLLLG
ncbi:hypothetical protein Taro_042206 [Colocasia esculenta]|uniref:RNase H type-1 domain-containing protein n=1 Tax=Colocasia esculenta TaxID=4460 RepID=A0A843WS54_COLES|nr:hypothetical protein [Colocasia esculenta]